MADDYDSPWKDAIERYFADFLHFFFPHAHAEVDWTRPVVFLDQELRAAVHDAELGRRLVDKLVKLTRIGGAEDWLYIHVEVQGDVQDGFAERMFIYNYRLYDRYRKPIASFAVLADDRMDWRPESFSCQVLGCRTGIHFPVSKLTDWAGHEAALHDSRNPFAVVTLAHLATRATRGDMDARYSAKWELVRGLYRRDWGQQQVVDLFNVLDWMMRLPKELDDRLWQGLEALEENAKMSYISSVERIGIEKGFEKGLQQGMQQGIQQGREQGREQGKEQGKEQGLRQGQVLLIARQLTHRFGELPAWAKERLDRASGTELEAWSEALLNAESIADIFINDRH